MYKKCFPEKGWQVLSDLKGLLAKYKATLAGGTALALQIGHRVSEDLDFFTTSTFRVDSIISGIKKRGLSLKVISEGEDYLTAEVGGIKISLFKYDYPFTQKPVLCESVPIAGTLDIASMKVISISQRSAKRDFVDLYFILQSVPFHKIAGHMVARFGEERINPIHIGKSLVYFSDADSEPEPAYLKGKKVEWGKIKDFFRRHVKQFILDLSAATKES